MVWATPTHSDPFQQEFGRDAPAWTDRKRDGSQPLKSQTPMGGLQRLRGSAGPEMDIRPRKQAPRLRPQDLVTERGSPGAQHPAVDAANMSQREQVAEGLGVMGSEGLGPLEAHACLHGAPSRPRPMVASRECEPSHLPKGAGSVYLVQKSLCLHVWEPT